jgi:CBS domain-containing protein
MKCNKVMTKNPVCCLPEDIVVKAAQMMKRQDVGSIPVIENEKTKKLVGVLTDRDLALKIVSEERNPQSTRVEDVMTRKVVTCGKADDMQKAVDLMAKNQLRRIPVLDKNDGIIGIVAQADIAKYFDHPKKVALMVKKISQPKKKKKEKK